MNAKDVRDEHGKFPHSVWPGGYPLYYIVTDGGILCPACANRENGSLARCGDTETQWDLPYEEAQWELAYVEVHWEGPPLSCDHCYAQIESAYGNPDQQEN